MRGVGCSSTGTSTVSFSKLISFVDTASHQLVAIGVSIQSTPVCNLCVPSTFLYPFHDLPFNTDEHPYPSPYDFCDFHPKDKERTFTLRSRV